jgi:hypothetical protein
VLSFSEITELKTEVVNELIENTLSPKTKKEIMTTYAQFIQKGKIEGVLQGKIEMLYKSWRKGFAVSLLADLSDLPETTIKLWINRFEMLQKCRLDKKTVAETALSTQLTEQQVTDWWAFFEKADQPK